MRMLLRLVAVAIACLPSSAFAGICTDTGSFDRYLASEQQTIVAAGAATRVDGAVMPFRLATGRDGSWTLFYIRDEVLACILVDGVAWTNQGKIPKADLRP